MSIVWAICGAGRGVGKTTVAQSIADVLDGSVYCKCGHNAAKAGKPDNFHQDIDSLTTFVDGAADKYSHIVVESNSFVYSQRADITVYIDGVAGVTDFRDDVAGLKAAGDIVISTDSSVDSWKKFLSGKIKDTKVAGDICKCLSAQRRWLFSSEPKVCSKVWFEAAGDHVFGRGLAGLLGNIDKLGTLRAASKASRMSYRYAWDMLKTAEKHLGTALIERHAGGAGGGSSTLSSKGRSMLTSFERINTDVAEFAEKRFKQLYNGEKNNG